MKHFHIYQAEAYCTACANKIRRELTADKQRPANVDDQTTFDSDDYPKGPFELAEEKVDSPMHCATCKKFLPAPLTTDGVNYVVDQIGQYLRNYTGSTSVLDTWLKDVKNYTLTNEQREIVSLYSVIRKDHRRAVKYG